MPQVKTITVYTFAELAEGARTGVIRSEAIERARETMREYTNETRQHYAQDDCAKGGAYYAALECAGFMEPKIEYSGFSSQGDGASFTASVDLRKMLESASANGANDPKGYGWEKFTLPANADDIRAIIEHYPDANAQIERTDHHYAHERTCAVRRVELVDNDGYFGNGADHETVSAFIEEVRMDACKWIYRSLEDNSDYFDSDAVLEQESAERDIYFMADGRRYFGA